MQYSGQFKIKKQDYDFYTRLLNLANFDELTDEQMINEKARKDDYIGITEIEFSNGNYITIDLASGGNNYFDNICLFNENGTELMCADCNFEIDSFSLFYDDDIYDVKMIIEE